MTVRSTYVHIHEVGGAFVTAFTRPDVIDPLYIQRAGDEITRWVGGIERPRLVFDFGSVRFLSSEALGMLVRLHKVLVKGEGELRIANVDRDVLRLFKLTGLPRLIKIHASVEEAVESLGA